MHINVYKITLIIILLKYFFIKKFLCFKQNKNTSKVAGYFEHDRIKSLPGQKFKINFEHFSGYLNVSNGHRLFYYFVTSQNDPANDPLLFWFNGGPGCSSLYGLFAEMGPYLINSDGKTLRQNPDAWNQNSSIVYLEGPSGVGFAYGENNLNVWNDDLTSQENYDAIKQFFVKFPAFRWHKLFLVGESYAGVYIPTLALRILDGMANYSLKLEGVAIGNGCVNDTLHMISQEQYGYAHGFLDEKLWKNFTQFCGVVDLDQCDLAKWTEFYNANAADPWWQLNQYDIYERCEVVKNTTTNAKIKQSKCGHFEHRLVKKFIANLKAKISGKWPIKKTLLKTTPSPIVTMAPKINENDTIAYNVTVKCENEYYTPALAIYFNLPEVRKALNVDEVMVGKTWVDCNTTIFDAYQLQYSSGMENVVKKVLDAGIRVLMYYGDTDMVCNFLLGQKFAEHLGLKLKTSDGKTPWTGPDNLNAGMKTEYIGGFTYTTIRGASHMVPQTKGPQIFKAINAFIKSESF